MYPEPMVGASPFGARRMAIATALRRGGWLDFGPFRWRDIKPGKAVRATVGVVTPLVIGAATHHLEYGVFAAIGALPAGIASFQGVSRTRVSAVALTAVGMAVSTFVGATIAARAPWLLVPAVALWAYLIGLMAAFGQRAAVAGLQWAVALLIATAMPLGPQQAAIRAALTLLGGLWQGVLVVASWVIRQGSVERAAVAASYRILGEYAADLAAGKQGPPPALAFHGVEVLRDPNPLLRTHLRLLLLALINEADRLRETLAALGREAARPTQDGESARTLLMASAAVLTGIADALATRRELRRRYVKDLRQRLAATTIAPDVHWRWAGEALLGALRGAVSIVDHLDEPGADRNERQQPPVRRRTTLAQVNLTVRAALSPSSEVGRHAVRLAAVAGIGELIAQVSHVFRGYWIVLTVLLVLKPDFSSTIYRGIQRSVGTAFGVVLGAVMVLLAHRSEGALVLGVGVGVVLAYAMFDVSFLLFSVFLADYVVVILALLGVPAVSTAVTRLADTAMGAALAFAAYLAWPTWEGASAQEKFADVIEAQGRYATALLHTYAEPGATTDARLRDLQIAARRARANAETSADRLADEPPQPPMTAALAHDLTSAVRRFAYAALALHAAVTQHRSAVIQQQPELAEFAAGLETATRQLAAALRSLQPPGPLPPLRVLQTALAATLTDDAVRTATDDLVDATNSIADILRRHLRAE